VIEHVQRPEGTGAAGQVQPGAANRPLLGPAFADELARAQRPEGLRFSNHALQRLERRGIELDAQTTARLEGGVAKVAAKGGRDSLVLVDGTAFVVSVPNRTVVTAVDGSNMNDQVFTNIDSAVIA
jgi:flagellar operon protein